MKFLAPLLLLAVLGGIFFAVVDVRTFHYQFEYGLSKNAEPKTVMLEEGLTREEIAERVASPFGYDDETKKQFHDTYRIMEWDAVNEILVPYLVETYGLGESDREILLTHNTVYLDRDDDILESLYVPGEYTFENKETVAEVAEDLITPLYGTISTATIGEYLDDDAVADLLTYVKNAYDLLPDLIPLPPQDVGLREENGRTLLVFSTIYYNRGPGPLELRADPSTIGTIGNFVRLVRQRIYRTDGTYRERPSGSFEWHHEHVHYHFTDFVEYKLEAVGGDAETIYDDLAQKSTFCIRDVSTVHLSGVDTAPNAEYRICGRERQGISVGWGDAYFHTYADQNLDITDLLSGTYRLSFLVNPEDRFDEVTKENNSASATIVYDKEAGTVEVTKTTPKDLPDFEHIHVEKTF